MTASHSRETSKGSWPGSWKTRLVRRAKENVSDIQYIEGVHFLTQLGSTVVGDQHPVFTSYHYFDSFTTGK